MEKFCEEQLNSQTVYNGKIFSVSHDEVRLPNDKKSFRDVVHHNGGVVIAALDGDSVILVKQYRYCIGEELFELPAGKLDKEGETPLDAAKRELTEETGYSAKNWIDLGFIYSSPGFSSEKLYLFLAMDLVKTQQNLEEDEFIEIYKYTLDEVKQMIKEGKIKDAKTICALMRAVSV